MLQMIAHLVATFLEHRSKQINELEFKINMQKYSLPFTQSSVRAI